MKNFGHTDPKNKTDVVYINYLSLVLRAIKSLDKFSPHIGEWKQAHGQARFVMTQVIYLYTNMCCIEYRVHMVHIFNLSRIS